MDDELHEPPGVPARGTEGNITIRTSRRQELLDRLAAEPEYSIQPPGDDAAGHANRLAYEEDLESDRPGGDSPGYPEADNPGITREGLAKD